MLWLVRRGAFAEVVQAWFVRARSREEALALVFGAETPEDDPVDVVEMASEGESTVLWESDALVARVSSSAKPPGPSTDPCARCGQMRASHALETDGACSSFEEL